MPEKHTILGGKVHVYRRDNSSLWQCSTYLAGKNRRVSTKEDGLAKAKDFAEDWYLQLRGKARTGLRAKSRTADGFRPMSTRSSTPPRGNARSIRKMRATSGNQNSSMIMSCSWPIPACGRTRRTALNIAT